MSDAPERTGLLPWFALFAFVMIVGVLIARGVAFVMIVGVLIARGVNG